METPKIEFYENIFSNIVTPESDTIKNAIGKDGKPMPIPFDRLPKEAQDAIKEKEKADAEAEKPTFLWMPRTMGIIVTSVSVALIIFSVVIYKKLKK